MRERGERNLAVSAPASAELRRQLRSDSEELIFIIREHKGRSWQRSEELGVTTA